jgi:ribose 1,5-bisphosphate isomerase
VSSKLLLVGRLLLGYKLLFTNDKLDKKMDKQKKFNQICRDIKSIKIQGAENVAKRAYYAYKLIPTKSSKKRLIMLRPTEPLLVNLLKIADKYSYSEIIGNLNKNQDRINKEVFRMIKNNSIIFTHCHSTTVIKSLIYSKNKGKKFEVHNTETRSLYQGRKTAKELEKAGIKTTMFIDSAMELAIKKCKIILLGADAITKKGVINKIGSGLISEIAKDHKIPLYILSDSLKYTDKKIRIEQRPDEEVWENHPKKLRIINPAFEFVPKENITGIISELGVLSYNEFLKRVKIQKG